jgi:GNAT superfamily N-acetyltransferase
VSLRTERLTPERWADLERLFGPRGATAGCWCQWVMLEKGERFDEVKGEEAHRRFEAQVCGGERRGLIAYDGDEPVGWLAYGPRRGFPRIDRAPSLQCDDADRVWSLPCFFVKSGRRGQGVATALLSAAVEVARADGATVLEGYPVASPGRQAAAFVWTGTVPLFEKCGFQRVDDKAAGKVRMRRAL